MRLAELRISRRQRRAQIRYRALRNSKLHFPSPCGLNRPKDNTRTMLTARHRHVARDGWRGASFANDEIMRLGLVRQAGAKHR